MELRHSANFKTKEAKDFVDSIFEAPKEYEKEGMLFRRNADGTIEALGPIHKVKPSKCDGCEFWSNGSAKISSALDGDLVIRPGCIRSRCIDEKDIYVPKQLSPQQLSERGKRMLKSAWKQRQEGI